MRLLLDTHILLWVLTDDPRLPAEIRSLILSETADLFFSAASIWEISIKSTLKRADFPYDPSIVRKALLDNGYAELPITGEHSIFVGSLPMLHADPFDRMLVAQANVEGMLLITHDSKLIAYPGPIRKI
ncbi:type II toxin-antitoxin system VapC family toxin [Pseudomonas multiresinivorans]|uniref:Type II toxin-antitoxin system VapC family toxin n=1 Tax=Pseudomonas multiresinivorans TaxID=95301 RepID=A0A7Z3BQI1_9PSED|nr:type II toxin-antitoxin system VapC family toxin [Pseudomonas multiresinivorans]QJP11228.1 type II toxin-antitoxin system VapC family toxin [Pseudomonas multiresinivorans]